MNSPHIIVDALNIVHAWGLSTSQRGEDLAQLVERLLARVQVIHDEENCLLTLVVDGGGERLTLEHPTRQESLTIVYAPAHLTADAVIEQMALRAGPQGHVMVASRDLMVRESVAAAGATLLTPEALAAWVTRSQRSQSQRLAARQQRNQQVFRNGLFD